jgi:hypothetical protein
LDQNGPDALSVAVDFGREEVAKELVQRGVRVHRSSLWRVPSSAMVQAAMLPNSWALELLLPRLVMETLHSDEPIRAAVAHGHYHHLPALGDALGRHNVLPALLREVHERGFTCERSAAPFVCRWLRENSHFRRDALEMADRYGCYAILSAMLFAGLAGIKPTTFDHRPRLLGVVRLLTRNLITSMLARFFTEGISQLILEFAE